VSDKSELLQSLKIDRHSPAVSTGIRWWQVMILVILFVVATIWLTRYFLSTPPQPVAPSTPAGDSRHSLLQSSSSSSGPVNDSGTDLATGTEKQTILNSSGYITARRMATVSAQIMGLITEVRVEEGMAVDQGQVLATLDATLAQISLELAQAQLDVFSARISAIQANLTEAQENYQRVLKNGFSSAAEISRSFAQMRSLAANLQSSEADLNVAKIAVHFQQERVDDHVIRAPFAGIVTVKAAQPGEIVAPSSAGGGFTRTGICTIVDMDSLEIEVDVNESFIGRVYAGQLVEAQLDAYPNWTIPASVIAIIPTADRAKATVQVRIKIEQLDPKILPDMGVKVAFKK
jgi:HlyD family secretion protein